MDDFTANSMSLFNCLVVSASNGAVGAKQRHSRTSCGNVGRVMCFHPTGKAKCRQASVSHGDALAALSLANGSRNGSTAIAALDRAIQAGWQPQKGDCQASNDSKHSSRAWVAPALWPVNGRFYLSPVRSLASPAFQTKGNPMSANSKSSDGVPFIAEREEKRAEWNEHYSRRCKGGRPHEPEIYLKVVDELS